MGRTTLDFTSQKDIPGPIKSRIGYIYQFAKETEEYQDRTGTLTEDIIAWRLLDHARGMEQARRYEGRPVGPEWTEDEQPDPWEWSMPQSQYPVARHEPGHDVMPSPDGGRWCYNCAAVVGSINSIPAVRPGGRKPEPGSGRFDRRNK